MSRISVTEKESNRRQSGVTRGEEKETDDDQTESGDSVTLFRDPSGCAIDSGHWYEASVFWGKVARMSAAGVRAANSEMYQPEND